jgi:hypothetical protein
VAAIRTNSTYPSGPLPTITAIKLCMTIKSFLNRKQKAHLTKECERCNMTQVLSKKLHQLNHGEVVFLIAILSDDLIDAFKHAEVNGFFKDRVKVK